MGGFAIILMDIKIQNVCAELGDNMKELTREQLETMIDTVSQGLDVAIKKRERVFDFYTVLYPKGFSEIHIANAILYSDLHTQMVDILEKLIGMMSGGEESSIWIDEENQAGRYIARALALYDRKYCKLFADWFLCQDLDHAVHQYEDAQDVISKWGLCSETAFVLQAVEMNPGQSGNELLEDLEEEYGDELSNYLGNYDLELDDDEEEGIEEEIDWGVGYSVRIEDPSTYATMFLDWDKDSTMMLVRYQRGKVKVLQYKTAQELQQAINTVEENCKKQDLLWTMETGNASGDLKWWGEPETPCDLLTLL